MSRVTKPEASGTPSDPGSWTRVELSRRLLAVARPVLAPLGISLVCRLIELLLGIGLFVVGGWALLTRVTGEPTWSIGMVAAVLIVMSLVKAVARYLEQFSGHWVAFRSLALLRMYFYDRLEPQAPAATEGADSGDLMSRVTKDVDRIEVFFAHTLVPALTAVLAPVIVLIWLGCTVSRWAALLLLPFFLLVGAVVPRWGARRTDTAARVIRQERGALAQHVTDSVQGVREVLAFNDAEGRLASMGKIEDTIGTAQGAAGRFIAGRRGVNRALVALALVAMSVLMASLYASGAVDAGAVGLALGATLGAFPAMLDVEGFAADLDQAFASARRVFDVTEQAPRVTDPDHPVESDGTGDIELRDVSFRYPPREGDPVEGPWALTDIGLRFPAGRVTAVVGASGSGKSTLASLLVRTWDPDTGSVRLSDTDVRDLTQQRLHELVAFAPQRPYVFNDTVRANLLLARPDASDDELDRVCARVGLTPWLESEPEGIDTLVGEMGERLSGGQRQRLALARALLREAPVTVLDEATSQVDRDTEARVLAGIREATVGRTLIVIAHRISTITDADRIVVLDAGRVVEDGTYADLIAADGALAALVRREAPGMTRDTTERAATAAPTPGDDRP